MEKELKKELRATKIQKAILYSIAAAGLLGVAVLAPNAMRMIEFFDGRPKKKGRRYNLKRALDRLLFFEFVEFIERDGQKHLHLTTKGQRHVTLMKAGEGRFERPKKWDKKWRVLIFDIREMNRGKRDSLRRTLKSVGFVRLQHSVWLFPYDCEDLVTLLKLDLRVGWQVIYMIVDKIENDNKFKELFQLR